MTLPSHRLNAVIGVILEITKWQPEVRGKAFINEEKPWTGTAFMLSLLANLFSTSFIVYRIWKVTKVKSASESRLTWFVSILAESAALQTLWLIFYRHDAVLQLRSRLHCNGQLSCHPGYF
ncbi:hypothetical protein K438DRAFT_764282 [Mycena galopus ATCC 62051]|nr:hypothetical protein K438DRAFT_764282 [Mycena galopus ATCC 62051]